MQCTLANALGYEPGAYVHDAGSMHLYDRHWEAALDLEEPIAYECGAVRGLGPMDMSWPEMRQRAWLIARGTPLSDPTPAELWYQRQLEPYL